MIADPFIMLGKTVPESRRDGRRTVCSAGYSPELGLIRIYPLAMRSAPRRWESTRVLLERNPRDSRKESFKLAGDRSAEAHASINTMTFHSNGNIAKTDRGAVIGPGDRRFKFTVNSIAEANRRRISLALIRPSNMRVVWGRPGDKRLEDMAQMELDLWDTFPTEVRDQAEPTVPRLQFTDEHGEHLLQLRDWGVHELIRHKGHRYAREHLAQALNLNPSSTLLIGNILRHQNSWLVISVLNFGDQMMLDLSA